MPCKRGQVEPDRHTMLRLFADSRGYCHRPECPNLLFVDTATKHSHRGDGPHHPSPSPIGREGSNASIQAVCVHDNAFG